MLEMEIHGPLSSDQRRDLDRIVKSAHHLLALINDILSFAKVEAGHVNVAIRRVRLDAMIESLDEMLQPLVRSLRPDRRGGVPAAERLPPDR